MTSTALNSKGRRITNRNASRRPLPGQTGPSQPFSFTCPPDLHGRIFAETYRLRDQLDLDRSPAGGSVVRMILGYFFSLPDTKRTEILFGGYKATQDALIAEAEAKAKAEIAARFRTAS